MTFSDDLSDRLDRIRSDWPVESMVDDVMTRVNNCAPRRAPKFGRNRVFAGLAASMMLATLALVWLLIFSRPASLLASVQNDLKHANSAHIAGSFAWHPVWTSNTIGAGGRLPGANRPFRVQSQSLGIGRPSWRASRG